MIPAHHVLRVGQSVQADSAAPQARPGKPSPSGRRQIGPADLSAQGQGDRDLDISLQNLNQLILELDPTFEPLQVHRSPSPDETDSTPVLNLIPRGCPVPSPSIAVPGSSATLSCSPQGALLFSGSPSSSSSCCGARPPLPCGSVVRRSPRPEGDRGSSARSSWRLSQPNRNSALSLLSTSSCSDTSYILGSTLSLTSEDADSSEFNFLSTLGIDSALSPKNKPLQSLHDKDVHSSPASLAGSLTDIPVLLVNGAPQPQTQSSTSRSSGPGLQLDLSAPTPASPHSPRCFSRQLSMKFVMDTSKQWFRPHITRAEAEAMVKNKEAGTFVIRDSTSYKGSFGLAMKVELSPTTCAASAYPGDSGSDSVRHFLIESSAKGVRIKGSSQEPYFGSLPALVYQHTISAYALPCKLLLSSQELVSTEDVKPTEDKKKTASNFVYLNAVPTEMLTGPCAVQKAVAVTFEKTPGSFTPAIVNLKVTQKGVTLTDINRKLFFRRHYPAHLLSYSGEDPDSRRWVRGSDFGAKMFGFVAKGVEAGVENVCHVFAEYDPLQPCHQIVDFIQATINKT